LVPWPGSPLAPDNRVMRFVRRRAVALGAAAALVVGGLAGAAWWAWGRSAGPPPAAAYVGRAACASCHAQADQRWRGSHHDLAMQPATEATVAGDFGGATFQHAGVTATFFRRDKAFVVRTDGPDGQLHDYEVRYTFGVTPLQQYLLELPGGRLQALSIAWDSRPRAEGGQRWFHLYPGERITHRDTLHWTGLGQNWNTMCAECHSTGIRKGYDAAARRFNTTYAEVNVACEACHGPGSNHVAWARREPGWRRLDGATKGLLVALDERKAATWTISAETGNAQRTPPRGSAREVETCGRCHARRRQFAEDGALGRPLGDAHRVSLLEPRLYHADGQIREEVYEYGAFRQSKMFARGVTCSDCHDPHSGTLRAPGSQLCLGCHAAAKYQAAAHHFHPPASRGADCLGCHMPATTYMVVDPRRDHSFRIPRPDLSVKLGVPNACTACHADRPASWAAAQVASRRPRGTSGYQRHAEALHAAASGAPGAVERLLTVARDGEQSAIARASALLRLAPATTAPALEAIRAGLGDDDSLVRWAAVRALDGAEPGFRAELLAPLLADPVRVVRMEAARSLADVPRDRLPEAQRAAFDAALAEYVAGEQFNADRPESHLNLALLHLSQRRLAEAEASLRTALEIDPGFVPAAVNLADLFRATHRDAEGERVLRDVLERDPRSGAARHALGLLLVRQRRAREAVPELEAAARLTPESARYGYVYAIALDGLGRRPQATDVLTRVLTRHPHDRDVLIALATWAYERGDRSQALTYARRVANGAPSSAELRQLLQRLR
jgi:predicted CXXCH cytochrome family protein